MVRRGKAGLRMTAWVLGLLVLAVIAIGVVVAKLARRTPASVPVTQEVDIALWDADAPAVDLLLDLPEVPAIEPARLGYNDSTLPATHDPSPVPAERSTVGKELRRGSWA